jgi:hypothetical protein
MENSVKKDSNIHSNYMIYIALREYNNLIRK